MIQKKEIESQITKRIRKIGMQRKICIMNLIIIICLFKMNENENERTRLVNVKDFCIWS